VILVGFKERAICNGASRDSATSCTRLGDAVSNGWNLFSRFLANSSALSCGDFAQVPSG